MADYVLDLSNYKDRVGARVKEGRYRVIVDDVEPDKSKAQNLMFNVWLRILDGDEKDLTITDRLTITEKSLFRVVGFMQAIGLQTPKKRIKINPQAWIGKVLEVDVADGDPYNGRIKSEVRGYMRVAKAATADVDDLGDTSDEEGLFPEEGVVEEPEDLTIVEEPEETAAQPTPIKKPAATEDEPEAVDLDTLDLG